MAREVIATKKAPGAVGPYVQAIKSNGMVYCSEQLGIDVITGKLPLGGLIEEGKRERKIYLPKGAEWTDAWTGENFTGGNWIEAEASIDTIPLYMKDGAELPIREN